MADTQAAEYGQEQASTATDSGQTAGQAEGPAVAVAGPNHVPPVSGADASAAEPRASVFEPLAGRVRPPAAPAGALALPAEPLSDQAELQDVPAGLQDVPVVPRQAAAHPLAVPAGTREAAAEPPAVAAETAEDAEDRADVAGPGQGEPGLAGPGTGQDDPAAPRAGQEGEDAAVADPAEGDEVWPVVAAPVTGDIHHVELWVPNLDRAILSWGWLLTALGYRMFQDWPGGRSWRSGSAYIVVEQSPARTASRHDRCRPGLNHLAFHVTARQEVDELTAEALLHGWKLMFSDLHPYAGGPQHYAAYLENADGFEVELVAG
jgi:hypothetical protein